MNGQSTTTGGIMRAPWILALLPTLACAQSPYRIVNGDGCPPDMRIANQQEIGTAMRQMCNAMAPDHIRRLLRVPQDPPRYALFGLKYGCQVREYTGTTLSSVCIARPDAVLPPPSPGSPCPSQPSSFGPRKAPAVAVDKSRFAIGVNEYLGNDEFLVSQNRAFHVVQKSDGNLQVYRGPNPTNNYGVLWQLQAYGATQPFITVQQADGNLCIYPASSPSQAHNAVWCHNKVAAGGRFFTILRNDGNLCTYSGTAPEYGLDPNDYSRPPPLWCSGTTSPTPWTEGQMIFAASGPPLGRAVWYGKWDYFPKAAFASSYMRAKTEQRWVFGADHAIRWAADRSKCIILTDNPSVDVGQCRHRPKHDYDPETNSFIPFEEFFDGWDYCPADNSIRNLHFPKGCLTTNGPLGDPNTSLDWDRQCALDSMGPDVYGETWTFQQWPQ
jgi:hypothetical protein